jgi:hypothetical protein
MNDDERKLIEKGVRAYSSLTIAEKETYDRLRQDYMLSIYKDMPSDIRGNINEYIDSLPGASKDFYQGYIAAMDWYRGLLKSGLHPDVVRMLDIYHLSMYTAVVHRLHQEDNNSRQYLESLFNQNIDTKEE